MSLLDDKEKEESSNMKNRTGTTPFMLSQVETADNYNYYPWGQFWLA